jgi:hypothetical protein
MTVEAKEKKHKPLNMAAKTLAKYFAPFTGKNRTSKNYHATE